MCSHESTALHSLTLHACCSAVEAGREHLGNVGDVFGGGLWADEVAIHAHSAAHARTRLPASQDVQHAGLACTTIKSSAPLHSLRTCNVPPVQMCVADC